MKVGMMNENGVSMISVVGDHDLTFMKIYKSIRSNLIDWLMMILVCFKLIVYMIIWYSYIK